MSHTPAVGNAHFTANLGSANPTKGHLSVVGQDQYPALGGGGGGSGKRRFLPWGVPDPPGGETRERPLILCGLKHGMR